MKKLIAFIVLFLIVLSSNAYSQPSHGTLVREVAIKWDGRTVDENTNWFQEDIQAFPSNHPRPVKQTLQYSCPEKTVVNIIIICFGLTKTFPLNEGDVLESNRLYIESVIVTEDMRFNFQHDKGAQNCSMLVVESFNNVDV